jgi:hypothetical protein
MRVSLESEKREKKGRNSVLHRAMFAIGRDAQAAIVRGAGGGGAMRGRERRGASSSVKKPAHERAFSVLAKNVD